MDRNHFLYHQLFLSFLIFCYRGKNWRKTKASSFEESIKASNELVWKLNPKNIVSGKSIDQARPNNGSKFADKFLFDYHKKYIIFHCRYGHSFHIWMAICFARNYCNSYDDAFRISFSYFLQGLNELRRKRLHEFSRNCHWIHIEHESNSYWMLPVNRSVQV